jgi:hypothetical protein
MYFIAIVKAYVHTKKNRKILDEVRDVMRLHHYSIHTERTCCGWIKRYVQYYIMTSREELINDEAKIGTFLTNLSVDKALSPSTQNQARNALVFLYKHYPKDHWTEILMQYGRGRR